MIQLPRSLYRLNILHSTRLIFFFKLIDLMSVCVFISIKIIQYRIFFIQISLYVIIVHYTSLMHSDLYQFLWLNFFFLMFIYLKYKILHFIIKIFPLKHEHTTSLLIFSILYEKLLNYINFFFNFNLLIHLEKKIIKGKIFFFLISSLYVKLYLI